MVPGEAASLLPWSTDTPLPALDWGEACGLRGDAAPEVGMSAPHQGSHLAYPSFNM